MSDDLDLLHGEPKQLAAFLGVSVRQINNYKTGKSPLPDQARRLLQLRGGDLSALLGSDWEGFRFHNGKLFIPGWSNGWEPGQIKGMFFTFQEAAALRQDVRDLRERVAALRGGVRYLISLNSKGLHDEISPASDFPPAHGMRRGRR